MGLVPALVSWPCATLDWLLTLVDCVSTLVFVASMPCLVIFPRGLCVLACYFVLLRSCGKMRFENYSLNLVCFVVCFTTFMDLFD